MTQRHTVQLASPETTSHGMAFFPPTYKVVLVGNLNVGKTTMLWRYLYHEFRTVEKRGTVVDVERKRIVVREREVEMEFWDTVGQEKYRTISPSYYNGAHAIMVMYDITEPESFIDVKRYWMNEIFSHFGSDADNRMPIMLIGTKCDQVDRFNDEQTIVKRRDVMDLKKAHEGLLGPLECSSRTGKNVDKAFKKIADELVKRDMEDVPSPLYPKDPRCSSC